MQNTTDARETYRVNMTIRLTTATENDFGSNDLWINPTLIRSMEQHELTKGDEDSITVTEVDYGAIRQRADGSIEHAPILVLETPEEINEAWRQWASVYLQHPADA
jgi:hypothetical protein